MIRCSWCSASGGPFHSNHLKGLKDLCPVCTKARFDGEAEAARRAGILRVKCEGDIEAETIRILESVELEMRGVSFSDAIGDELCSDARCLHPRKRHYNMRGCCWDCKGIVCWSFEHGRRTPKNS